ncbi:isopeptide-forming domain-containing fimbrial protein [Lachnospiraceae bacterium AM25-27]|jgi:fimbrial isopeptide formation D2 family protein|nr:isopeptide-forming domain-containing fimbrial protein [Lachnospiraceae bacterium AM25-27]
MKKKKWKQIFCRMLAVVMSVLMMPTSVFAQISVDTAKKIDDKWGPTDTKKFSSFDDSKALKVKGSYGFRLYRTKNTKFTVEEGKSCKYPTSYNGLDLSIQDFQKEYLWFKTSENSVNKIKVKVSNMEIYQCNDDGSNGHWVKVDMVRTVTGIEKYKSQDGYIALGDGVTNTVYIGLEEVKTNSTFYKAGTSEKVSLKSNVTLKDIDSHQYIGVKANKVDGQYVSKNTKLSYKEDNGTYIYYANYDNDYDSEDFTCAAFIFEGNSFEYTFGRNLAEPTRHDQFVGSGQNMVKFETVPPTKSVSDNNETNVTSNTVEHFGQDWTYNIEQVIPTQIPEAHHYSGFQFEDQIESCMKINSVKVVASNMEKEKNATSWFDITTDGNKVVAKLKDAKGNDDFYKYGIYTLKVNVSLNIPDNATQEQMAELKKQWKEHGHYDESKNIVTENNTAKTIIDGNSSTTNQVTTKVEGPEKTVSDADESNVTNNTVRSLADDWTYSITEKVAKGADEKYTSFVFKDPIEECMKINSVKVKDNNGNDVSDWFNITTDNNNVVAALKDPQGNADFYNNTAYTMDVNVKMNVPDNCTEEQLQSLKEKWEKHGHYSEDKTVIHEENEAFVEINGKNAITNKPTTNVELSKTVTEEPGLNIEKTVNRYEHQVGETAHYTVKVRNSNPKADTAYFIIKDTTLPDTMAFDFSSVKVSGIDKDNYTIEQSGNGWVLKSKGDYALPYGTTITVEYDAKALTAGNGTTVDNTATTVAAGIPEMKDDAQVYINSPKVDVVKKAPDTKYKVGDTVGYKVTITNRNPGTFMRDIVLKDIVKTKGLEIKEGSVAVMVGGKNVTSNLDVSYEDDGRGFTINTPYNLKNGTIPCIGIAPYKDIQNWTDKITVTYDATITDDAALESDLENVFSAPATPNTNGDVIKDDPLIPSGGGEDNEDIKLKAPMLEITKKSNKQKYSVGETGNYTLVVKQTKENLTAKNVVITDKFVQEEGLAYDADSITVKLNKDDITKDCKINVDGNQFKIETGKNITDEDKIEVTYNVTFSKEGEYTNTAIATSDNTNEDQANNVVEVEKDQAKIMVDKSSDKSEYKKGEVGKYTLKVTTPDKLVENVVINDNFEKTGMSIANIVVTLNDEDITDQCGITQNDTDNGFKIETGKDITSQDTILVTYDVTFDKQIEGDIKNTVTAKGDNTDLASDTNIVTMKKADKVTTTEKPKTTKTVTPSTNSGSITGSVKTGQTSILPIMIAAIVAILAAAGIFVIRKRQK